MKKINPLVITAAFVIAGIYIGIVKVAGRGIERIVDILLAAFTVDTAIDLVCSLLFTAIGFESAELSEMMIGQTPIFGNSERWNGRKKKGGYFGVLVFRRSNAQFRW